MKKPKPMLRASAEPAKRAAEKLVSVVPCQPFTQLGEPARLSYRVEQSDILVALDEWQELVEARLFRLEERK